MTPTKRKPRISTNKEAHRHLHLVSPPFRGADVRELQQSLNHLCNHYGFDWHHIVVDGVYGKRTRRQAHFAAWLIGLEEKRLDAIKHQGRITEEVQRLLRNPEKRSDQDRRREDDRRPRVKKLRRDHDALEEAVRWMLKQKGVNEQPPYSNHGPYPIDECQAYFDLSAVPWCGCAVGFAIEKVAGVGDTGTWWPHAESIRLDAEAGRNGLRDINPRQITRGTVVTFWPGGSDDDDHVAMATGDVVNGRFSTVEGNTSSGLRDADGGIFETKTHSIGEVTCAAQLTIN